MRRLLPFLVLLFPVALGAAGEAAPADFTFRVRRANATIHLETDGGPLVRRLVISFSAFHLPAQVIECEGGAENSMDIDPAHPDRVFESADYDEDGYNDFSVLDASGTAVNHIRHFFFYHPGRHQFVRRRDFDESGVADYDPSTGIFSRYWRGGPTAGGASYRFQHGRLVLLRTVQKAGAESFRDILPHASELDTYIVTTVYLPGGRIRRFYSREGP
ncbi:XAC2610-related protein [Prosthecobacter sp.]|uniref:XAC2610-related protein n=1 Tax=Prosthecobacter sp. TaxID=1965333 RepID=UPI00378391C9